MKMYQVENIIIEQSKNRNHDNKKNPSISFKKIYKSLNQRIKSIKNRFMVGDKSVLLYSTIHLITIFVLFHLASYFSASAQNKFG